MYYDSIGFEVLHTEHYRDLQNDVRIERLIQLARVNGRQRIPVFHRFLAGLGSLMVTWGSQLQTRYEDLTIVDHVNLSDSSYPC